MDIVTHAMIGGTMAAGVFPERPGLAIGLAVGNVLPDLDAFSRLGGKNAFMRFHQTYTHSIAAVSGVVTVAVITTLIPRGPIWLLMLSMVAWGTALGMLTHIGLDLTNSYGIKCLWPISNRRYKLDWIFFIDVPIVVLSAVTLALMYMHHTFGWWIDRSMFDVALIYLLVLMAYVMIRAALWQRARRLAGPDDAAVAVIPTAWPPTRYLVCRSSDHACVTSRLSVLSGRHADGVEVPIYDDDAPPELIDSVPWRTMRSLSSFFHVVEIEAIDGDGVPDNPAEPSAGFRLRCDDLRIRNFGTAFGRLDCRIDRAGRLSDVRWNV